LRNPTIVMSAAILVVALAVHLLNRVAALEPIPPPPPPPAEQMPSVLVGEDGIVIEEPAQGWRPPAMLIHDGAFDIDDDWAAERLKRLDLASLRFKTPDASLWYTAFVDTVMRMETANHGRHVLQFSSNGRAYELHLFDSRRWRQHQDGDTGFTLTEDNRVLRVWDMRTTGSEENTVRWRYAGEGPLLGRKVEDGFAVDVACEPATAQVWCHAALTGLIVTAAPDGDGGERVIVRNTFEERRLSALATTHSDPRSKTLRTFVRGVDLLFELNAPVKGVVTSWKGGFQVQEGDWQVFSSPPGVSPGPPPNDGRPRRKETDSTFLRADGDGSAHGFWDHYDYRADLKCSPLEARDWCLAVIDGMVIHELTE